MGIFAAADVIGRDKDAIPKRPWFADLEGVQGFAGAYVGREASFAGKVFASDQAVLDTITADNRTKAVIPLAIKGGGIRWANENDNVSSATRGNIVAWLAAQGLKGVPANTNTPGEYARHIMKEVTRLAVLDALESFRTYWS